MRTTRIYQPAQLVSGEYLDLLPEAAHHVTTVLRMKKGQSLVLFNGEGGQFDATLEEVTRRRVTVHIGSHHAIDIESPLQITLVQGISRGSRMDVTLQKAVELGVRRIVPVMTEFSNVRLNDEQQQKRLQHWQGVVIAACEQCGRNRLAQIEPPLSLPDWLSGDDAQLKLILHPRSGISLTDIREHPGRISLLAGPEGGFSDAEYELSVDRGYQGIRLGPRVLRTETAALVALAACQTLWGDMQGRD